MSIRCFVLLIVAFAFTMTSMVPKGFMSSVDENGKIAIVICSGVSQKTIYIDQEQAPEEGNEGSADADDEQQPDSCPATIVSHQQLLTPVATLFVPLSEPFEIFDPSFDSVIIQKTTTIAHSRAPPLFA